MLALEHRHLRGARVVAIEQDPRSRQIRLALDTGLVLVVNRARAVRQPAVIPEGARAEIVDVTGVTTDEAAILTLSLKSGDTLQFAGSGLAVLATAA